MNVQEFTEAIARKKGLSKAFSRVLLDTVLDTIREELRRGHTVRLRNFGTFEARKSHGKLRAKFDDSENFFA